MNIDRNLRTRILMALPIAAVALSLAACGGAAERPSVEAVSEGMTTILEDGGQGDVLTGEQIDCVAEALHSSEISDQDLANIADGKDLQTSEEAQELVTSTMSDAVVDCASAE